jgi:hypothetical protein
MVTATKLDDDGNPIGIVRRLERAEPVRSFRPTGAATGEVSRENVLGARAVAVRADAMRHARIVLDSLAPGELAPGEHGPAPCSGPAILAALDDPATVGALRVLAVAGMRCIVSRSNARGEVTTTYRPVDPFGREASEAIGSLWLANATQSWRHGAPRTLAGVVSYLRTVVRRMSRMIAPRAKVGGPAAPLPLVSAADVVGAGGIDALLDAEHAAAMLARTVARLSPTEATAARAAAEARVSGERMATDGTTRRSLAKIAAMLDKEEP